MPSHIPEEFPSIVPFLVVAEPERLITFLEATFETEILERSDDHGKLYLAMRVAGSVIEISQSNEQWAPRPATLHVYVEDTDSVYQKALTAGAQSLFEPSDMPYGERGAGVEDFAGNHWYLATFARGSEE